MNMKKYTYLYLKVHNAGKENIMQEANLTDDEFAEYEEKYAAEAELIKSERSNLGKIGEEMVRYTRYIYEDTPDQQKGTYRPEAVNPHSGEIIPLPAVGVIAKPEMTLVQAIEQRRSLRKYQDTPLTRDELSFLLWATQWVRDFRSTEKVDVAFRNVPSAGARHPYETYLLINKVEGIAPGIYYYHPLKHGLVSFLPGEERVKEVFHGTFDQEMVQQAAVTFIWLAIPYRTVWRYGQRAYRYIYLDAGHLGQNLHLAAEAIGCGACMIGAFYDEGMNELLNLDGKEVFVIYMASVGKK